MVDRVDFGQPAVGQALQQLARQAQAIGMDAAGIEQHDHIPGGQLVAHAEPRLGVDQPGARGRQVNAAVGHDAGQRRGFSAAPGHFADITGLLPARHQGLTALRVGKPVRPTGGPISLHHQRRGTHGDQIVHRHRDGVLRNAGIRAAAGQGSHLVGHQGFGAQAFDDGGDVERAHIHHVSRLAARGLHLGKTVPGQVHGRRSGGLLGVDLQRIDQAVVDPRLLVAEGVWMGGFCAGGHAPDYR